MKFKNSAGYHFFILSLLFSSFGVLADEGKVEQLIEQKRVVETETDTLRQTTEESRLRLERLKQRFIELRQQNRSLDTEIKATLNKIKEAAAGQPPRPAQDR